MDQTYHRDIGFPAGLRTRVRAGTGLTYSHHARQAALDEGIDSTQLPAVLPPAFARIEVTVDAQRRIQKQVIRFKWDDVYDAVLVVLEDGFVKTIWLNDRTDTHKTLRVERYARPAA